MSAPTITLRCPHEIRPGTTVCLHCAAAARRVVRARTRRTMARVAAGVAVMGGASAVAVAGGSVTQRLRAAEPARAAAPQSTAEVQVATETNVALVGNTPAPDAPAVPAASRVVPAAASVAAAPAVAAPSAVPPTGPRLHPRIGEGHTALGGGVTAERRGDTVLVLFDTPTTRTRRADKFEGTVRATLPALYGAAAGAALAGVPRGKLVAAADLAGAAPRGVRVALPDGQALALRPETRPGRDGPLVVRYAVTLASTER